MSRVGKRRSAGYSAIATTYLLDRFGSPREMETEDERDRWMTRLGLLLDFQAFADGFDACKPRRRRVQKPPGALSVASAALATDASRSKGGRARALALSPERRREIAKAAARARWRKHQ